MVAQVSFSHEGNGCLLWVNRKEMGEWHYVVDPHYVGTSRALKKSFPNKPRLHDDKD